MPEPITMSALFAGLGKGGAAAGAGKAAGASLGAGKLSSALAGVGKGVAASSGATGTAAGGGFASSLGGGATAKAIGSGALQGLQGAMGGGGGGGSDQSVPDPVAPLQVDTQQPIQGQFQNILGDPKEAAFDRLRRY